MVSLGSIIAQAQQHPGLPDTSNHFAMDQSAARSVRLPTKPGARPALSDEERDALEHRIRCQCGCTLDVYTCRTTDLVCQVAPSMHRDVLALAQGGHSADEIREAFAEVYGDDVLLAPPARGLNLLAYVAPTMVTLGTAVMLTVRLRRGEGRGA